MTAGSGHGNATAPSAMPGVLHHPAALIALVAVLCLIPLFVTPVLPLIDFYAHVARYHVLANAGTDPALAANYAADWKLLPNLGLDLIGTGVMALAPPLIAAKLLAALIVLAPYFGALVLARALLGRVTPVNVALAGLLAYSFILTWGFANFILGLGIALAALGLWVAQRDRPWLQLATGVALGLVIMLVHGLVFGLWGLLLFTVEVMLIREVRPIAAARIAWRIARLGLVAIGPVALFLATQTASAEGGVTQAFANLAGHAAQGDLWSRLASEVWQRADSVLRVAESTFPLADRLFGAVLWAALAVAFLTGALRLNRRLALAVPLVLVLVVVMPPNLFGVGHLDERMPLVLLALLAAGATVGPMRWPAPVFGTLMAGHLAMVTVGWAWMGLGYRDFLAATATLDRGGLGTASFSPAMQDRDASRACKPLLFLLLLQNGTAVSTFSNPTQQPLRIIGPLRDAIDATGDIPITDPARQTQAGAGQSGFDRIVVCDPDPVAPGDTRRLVAEGQGWALFRLTEG